MPEKSGGETDNQIVADKTDTAKAGSGDNPEKKKLWPSLAFYNSPPTRNPRFWIGLAALAIPFTEQYFLGHTFIGRSAQAASGSIVPPFVVTVVYAVPVVYAALNFGFLATIITAAAATGLATVDMAHHLTADDTVDVWGDNIQIVIIDIIGAIVGHYVEVSQRARIEAEHASEAHRKAESRYRELFQTTRTPIVLVDDTGKIAEANPAFLREVAGRNDDVSAGDDPTSEIPSNGIPVIEILGTELSAIVGVDVARAIVAGSPIVVPGIDLSFRVEGTEITGTVGNTLLQVVFHDVTEEERRSLQATTFATHVLQVQEDERRRIAEDLHDEPVQRLIHLSRVIDAIQPDSLDAATRDAVAEARKLSQEVMEGLREIARGLRPVILEELGLISAITMLTNDLTRRSGIVTSLELSGDEIDLDDRIELALYRIAQEALTNVEKHSRASSAAIAVNFSESHVTLRITDDGIGLPDDISTATTSANPSALGIIGIQERAKSILGDLEIEAPAGGGARITIRVGTESQ